MSKICTKLLVLAVLLLAATFTSATAIALKLKTEKKAVYTFSKFVGDTSAWEDSSSSSSSGSGGGNNYAYLILALQKCESSSPWTIHGLWPSYANGNSGPQYCSNVAFQQSLVQDLWQKIDQYWPTCSWSHNTEDNFLSHEWSKHGTCTGDSEHAYFSEVLTIFLQNGWQSHCDSSENECKVTVNKSYV